MPSVSIPRELTLDSVYHPDTINGRTVVRLGTNLHDLADRIQNGCPASGWEGDPRMTLALYQDPRSGRKQVELWRLEHDGEYRMEARLRPNAAGVLDPSDICWQLVKRDARRGYDIRDAVDRHNAKVRAASRYSSADRMSGAADKLAHALRQDLGIRTHWAAPNRKVGA